MMGSTRMCLSRPSQEPTPNEETLRVNDPWEEKTSLQTMTMFFGVVLIHKRTHLIGHLCVDNHASSSRFHALWYSYLDNGCIRINTPAPIRRLCSNNDYITILLPHSVCMPLFNVLQCTCFGDWLLHKKLEECITTLARLQYKLMHTHTHIYG